MIELERISRVFQVGDQAVHALREVTLTIADGEYVSLMGPSGSGKSTLLNILGLLDRASQRHLPSCGPRRHCTLRRGAGAGAA